MGTNVICGIGAQRDQALKEAGRGVLHSNPRAKNGGIPAENRSLRLNLETHSHVDFANGDFASIVQGRLEPLDESREFAGVIEQIGEGRGGYEAAVLTRGALHLKVHGLNSETPEGAKVFARSAGRTQLFSLEAQGVLIGEILAVENLERGIAIVGIRTAGDTRPFELGGPRPSR